MNKMKIWKLLLVALLIGQHAQMTNGQEMSDDASIYKAVDVMPEFPGGQDAMIAYLTKNLRYPDAAMKNGIQGKVYVSFVVTKTGDISNVQVSQSLHPLCDAEAVRVVKAMPKWIPGKQKGQNVNVVFSLPIAFKLTK